jgi:hypothetical protein
MVYAAVHRWRGCPRPRAIDARSLVVMKLSFRMPG